MSKKQTGGEPFPEYKAVRTYEGMDQIYGPGKDNKAFFKPENIFNPMKETEQTLLDQIKDQVTHDRWGEFGTRWRDLDSINRLDLMDKVCEAYATAKAQASCEATLKNASENAKFKHLYDYSLETPQYEKTVIDKSSITDKDNIVII